MSTDAIGFFSKSDGTVKKITGVYTTVGGVTRKIVAGYRTDENGQPKLIFGCNSGGNSSSSITLSTYHVYLGAPAYHYSSSVDITVTRPGNGAVSVFVEDTSVATATVSNASGETPIITVTYASKASNTTQLTISVAESGSYPASSIIIPVSVYFGLPEKRPLDEMSWTEISAISNQNCGSEYWSVGDRKAVNLTGSAGQANVFASLCVYILGFNHNSDKEGFGIHFGTFKSFPPEDEDKCLVDDYYNTYEFHDGTKSFQMNHVGTSSNGNTNYGGWKACDMRYDILGSTNKAPSGYLAQKTTSAVGYDAPDNTATNPVANTLMAALPSDLRAVMKPITKYTDNVGSGSTNNTVTTSVDYLPLLAEFEVLGIRRYANQYEQNHQLQYAYYRSGNSKIKYSYNSNNLSEKYSAMWWLRSPYSSDFRRFCYVNTGGSTSSASASVSLGLAPVFMV